MDLLQWKLPCLSKTESVSTPDARLQSRICLTSTFDRVVGLFSKFFGTVVLVTSNCVATM